MSAAPNRPEHENRWEPFNNGCGKRMWFLASRDDGLPIEARYHYGSDGRLVRFSSYATAQRAAKRLHSRGSYPANAG